MLPIGRGKLAFAIIALAPSGSSSACQRCHLLQVVDPGTLDGPRTVPQIQEHCPCEQRARNLLIDVGTSFGAEDMLAWHKQNRSRRVVGFEPLPENCANVQSKMGKAFYDQAASPGLLRRTVTDQRRFECKTVGETVGNMLLHVKGLQGSSLEKDAGAPDSPDKVIAVNVTTIDAEVAAADHVWVLKIDVQGGELGVLRGAGRLLTEGRLSWVYLEFDVIMLHAAHTGAADLLTLLAASNFSCVNSRQRNRHQSLGYVGELQLNATGHATAAKHCGYTCPCRYTNLLCGSHRVAMPLRGWKEELLRDFCYQPFCHAESRRLKRGICEAGEIRAAVQ